MPLRGIDDDGGNSGKHVAHNGGVVAAVYEAEMIHGVAGGVQDSEMPVFRPVRGGAEGQAVAIPQGLPPQIPRGHPFVGGFMGPHRQLITLADSVKSTNMVGVMMGEQHGFKGLALCEQLVHFVKQPLLLRLVRGRRINDIELVRAGDQGVGGGRGGQGGRGQGRHEDARREIDRMQHPLLQTRRGGLGVGEKGVQVGAVRHEPQEKQHRRGDVQLSPLPGVNGAPGLDEPPLHQLVVVNGRGLVVAGPSVHELGIEANGNERRRRDPKHRPEQIQLEAIQKTLPLRRRLLDLLFQRLLPLRRVCPAQGGGQHIRLLQGLPNGATLQGQGLRVVLLVIIHLAQIAAREHPVAAKELQGVRPLH